MLPSVVCFKLGYKWKLFTEMKIFCIYVGSHAGNNPCLLQWVSSASDHMNRILLVIKGQKHCKSNSRHLFNFSVICLTQSKKARNKSTRSSLAWSLNPTAGLIDPHLPFNQCCLTLWYQVWVTHSPVSSCVRFVRLPDGLGMILLKLLSEKAEKCWPDSICMYTAGNALVVTKTGHCHWSRQTHPPGRGKVWDALTNEEPVFHKWRSEHFNPKFGFSLKSKILGKL